MSITTSEANFVERVTLEGRTIMTKVTDRDDDRFAKWCRTFADSILKVAKKLGIEVELYVHNDCFWIRIKASREYNYTEYGNENLQTIGYTEESSNNMDIIGFDYHHFVENGDEYFRLFTSVGCRRSWYNQYLFPKLRGEPDFIRQIEKVCAPCHFDRMIRFNKIAAFIFVYIEEYKSLQDYLNDVCHDGIYFPSMTPDECIEKLKKLGVTEGYAIDKLETTRRREFNVLEYFNIVTEPPINCESFLAEDPATITDFENQIERHLKVMLLIDKTYQFFKANSTYEKAKVRKQILQFK